MRQAELEALVERIAAAERQAHEELARARRGSQERLSALAEALEAEHRRQIAELKANLTQKQGQAVETLEREVQALREENAAYIRNLQARDAEVRRAIIAWAVERVAQ